MINKILPGDLLIYPWKNGHPGHACIVEKSATPTDSPAALAALVRAEDWLGRGTYGLGKGGWKPGKVSPLDSLGRCDCTGFAYSWCYQHPRYDAEYDIWWNTTAIYQDALTVNHRFQLINADVDLAKLDIIHCHGGKAPAISRSTGLLWKKKHGIVCRPIL